jgi:plasmid maintenance system antidote protein VapI
VAAGRPTKYSDAYCNEVIAAGDEGLSLTAFAGMIGVARSTINEWMDAHPEFSEAVKKHQAKRTLALERGLLGSDQGPRVTARIFALKNAAPDEWADKQQIDLGITAELATIIAQRRAKVSELNNGNAA